MINLPKSTQNRANIRDKSIPRSITSGNWRPETTKWRPEARKWRSESRKWTPEPEMRNGGARATARLHEDRMTPRLAREARERRCSNILIDIYVV